MKKWGIIIGSFLLILFLAIRGIYKTAHRIDDERQWYVNRLNMTCTLQIDSIATFGKSSAGYLHCNLISGEINPQVEFQLNKKLRHHKRIKFLDHRSGGRYILLSRRANKYLVGDSLCVECPKDQVIFYRAGKEIWKAKVTNSLRAVVF